MDYGRTSSYSRAWFGSVAVAAGCLAAAVPLVVAIVIAEDGSELRSNSLVIASVSWLALVLVHRSWTKFSEQRRRQALRDEIAETRRARLEGADAFQHTLLNQQAILEQIDEISSLILEEGIIDPRLAVSNIRMIQSHARDAGIQAADALLETRVAIGARSPDPQLMNLRDGIEEVAAPFARGGYSIATDGSVLHGTTDPAMFRLIVRSLISSAIAREAEHIGVSVASNHDRAVCTVSDDGPDCRRQGTGAVSALARSLAGMLDAGLDYSHALGRNQFSIDVPLAAAPQTTQTQAAPMDVLGNLPPSQRDESDPQTTGRALGPEELIQFVKDRERSRDESVAGRRGRHLIRR
ncbi:MAG: hypothetical protein QNJ81_08720 [Acidimicrobiia bacterium]|nr:hypothetical protein [Acidimicrobiia bacterium]